MVCDVNLCHALCTVGVTVACTLPGGAISNLYAVAVARFKAQPRSKQQGMTSLSSRLVMFASEHVSDFMLKTTCIYVC